MATLVRFAASAILVIQSSSTSACTIFGATCWRAVTTPPIPAIRCMAALASLSRRSGIATSSSFARQRGYRCTHCGISIRATTTWTRITTGAGCTRQAPACSSPRNSIPLSRRTVLRWPSRGSSLRTGRPSRATTAFARITSRLESQKGISAANSIRTILKKFVRRKGSCIDRSSTSTRSLMPSIRCERLRLPVGSSSTPGYRH